MSYLPELIHRNSKHHFLKMLLNALPEIFLFCVCPLASMKFKGKSCQCISIICNLTILSRTTTNCSNFLIITLQNRCPFSVKVKPVTDNPSITGRAQSTCSQSLWSHESLSDYFVTLLRTTGTLLHLLLKIASK